MMLQKNLRKPEKKWLKKWEKDRIQMMLQKNLRKWEKKWVKKWENLVGICRKCLKIWGK